MVTLAVLAAVLAITLFGVPLGYAVAASFLGDEAAEAEHVADVAAIGVAAHLARDEPVTALPLPGAEPVTSLPSSDSSLLVALYSPDGTLVTGDGPARADSLVSEALG